jgi:hypothetical protein
VEESEQTPLVDMTVPDKPVEQDRSAPVSEQPAIPDSEPETAVAVLDAQKSSTEAVDSESLSDPVGIAEESSTADPEPAVEAATTVSEGAGVEKHDSVAEEPQIGDSPTENTVDPVAQTTPISQPESTESPDIGVVAEAEPAGTVAVSSETVADEVPTAVESAASVSEDAQDIAITEADKPESPQDASLDIPLMPMEQSENVQDPSIAAVPTPVEENTEKETERKRTVVIEPLAAGPIPARFAFLPVQSARYRPGYALRGLF